MRNRIPWLDAGMATPKRGIGTMLTSTHITSNPLASVHLSMSKPSDSCWSIDSNGFLHLNDHIYVPDADDLRLHVLQYKYDHLLSRHFGQNQTLELIRHEYTWPGVRTFVKEYVSSCTTCACTKVPRYKRFGLLKQLPILEKPWNSISMDFIEQLPNSSRYTTILMVVDQLSKQCIFIPTDNKVTFPELAKLFLLHVFSKHGVPSHITSNWGLEFVSHFFCSLGKALDIHLRFTFKSIVTTPATSRVLLQQCSKCYHRCLPLLCQQRLPSEHLHTSGMRPYLWKSLRVFHWPWLPPPIPPRRNGTHARVIPRTCWCQMNSGTGLQSQWLCIHQSKILQVN